MSVVPGRAVAALLFSIITNLGSAELTTFSLSIPVDTLFGSKSGLFAASPGDQLSEVFIYDGDMLPTQTLDDKRFFIPPDGSVFAEATLAGVTYSLNNHFQLDLFAKETVEVNGELIYGDFAVFFANGEPMAGPEGTTLRLYSQMMFPVGTFGADARLPDFPPAWAFTSLGIVNTNEDFGLASGETAVGPGLDPVPESSTYGFIGALGLIGLAGGRLRSIFLLRKSKPIKVTYSGA